MCKNDLCESAKLGTNNFPSVRAQTHLAHWAHLVVLQQLLVAGERSSWDVVLHTDAAAGGELDRVVSVTTGNGTRRSSRAHTKAA